MSKPAPSQQSPFMRVLLVGMLVFLGYQLFITPMQKPSRPPADVLTELKKANAEIKDITAKRLFDEYGRSLNSDSKLPQAERDKAYLQAEIIVADTQYKAAKQRKDYGRIVPTSDMMISLQRRWSSDPAWNAPVEVASHKEFPRTSVTPAQMKEDVRTLASDLGKTTPVWGFFPGYEMIDALVKMTGGVSGLSYWLCCLILAALVRTIVFPLSHKQMMWGRRMSQLSPLMNEIKAKYQPKGSGPLPLEKQNEMQQAMMNLYKEYGMNPAAGCLPMFAQLPLFLLVYQSMLHYRYEFEKGTFLWINDAVGQSTNGFLGANLGQKDYALLTIYAISMVVTSLLTPVSDPTNARQARLMGIGISATFGVMMFFWPVPSAFVLYWTFTNILATAQSLWAYRLPLPPLEKKNHPTTGGVFPISAAPNGTTPSGPRKTGVPQRHKPKKKK